MTPKSQLERIITIEQELIVVREEFRRFRDEDFKNLRDEIKPILAGWKTAVAVATGFMGAITTLVWIIEHFAQHK